MNDSSIRLVLVDDHAVMRAGLANMLNVNPSFRVVGEADDGEPAIALCRTLRPDVVLLDVTMPGLDGIETLRRLKRDLPDVRVLMLSSSEAEEDILQSMRSGACGYISKAARPAELVAAIQAAHAGSRVISPSLEKRLAEMSADTSLTGRELEVLTLLRKGMSNPDIARILQITPRTAKAHVASILVKLDAADRAEAVARGFERGLLKP